jgi:hypothetical protein
MSLFLMKIFFTLKKPPFWRSILENRLYLNCYWEFSRKKSVDRVILTSSIYFWCRIPWKISRKFGKYGCFEIYTTGGDPAKWLWSSESASLNLPETYILIFVNYKNHKFEKCVLNNLENKKGNKICIWKTVLNTCLWFYDTSVLNNWMRINITVLILYH